MYSWSCFIKKGSDNMKRLDLNISVLSEDIVSKAVLITGSARSGTTLMGKLIELR